MDLSFKELAATISNVGIGQHGYCYLMDERGNMVYHPQQQLLYAGLKKEEAGRLACLGDGTYVEDTVIYSVQRVPGSRGASSVSATSTRPSTRASGRWPASLWLPPY